MLDTQIEGQNGEGATTIVVDLAKASKTVQFRVVWKCATYFHFSQAVSWVLCGYFAHERRAMFESHVSEPMVIITAILTSSKWSVLLLIVVFFDNDLGVAGENER